MNENGSGSGGSVINWPSRSGFVILKYRSASGSLLFINDSRNFRKIFNYFIMFNDLLPYLLHNLILQWPQKCTGRICIRLDPKFNWPPVSGSVPSSRWRIRIRNNYLWINNTVRSADKYSPGSIVPQYRRTAELYETLVWYHRAMLRIRIYPHHFAVCGSNC